MLLFIDIVLCLILVWQAYRNARMQDQIYYLENQLNWARADVAALQRRITTLGGAVALGPGVSGGELIPVTGAPTTGG